MIWSMAGPLLAFFFPAFVVFRFLVGIKLLPVANPNQTAHPIGSTKKEADPPTRNRRQAHDFSLLKRAHMGRSLRRPRARTC